jgi:hypothetical protein
MLTHTIQFNPGISSSSPLTFGLVLLATVSASQTKWCCLLTYLRVHFASVTGHCPAGYLACVTVAQHFSVTLSEITLRLLTLGDGWGQKPVSWQSHSPDMHPLDFFHWRHLKNLVYTPAMENSQELLQCIQNGCTSVDSTPGTFQCVCQSMHCWAKLVWQCMANILGIYCNPKNNSYLLSLECKATFSVNCCIIS